MAWVTLPDLIFSDIMMKVGLESLENLHRCRQVCRTWNDMILSDIWENQSKKRIMKERIERSWEPGMFPSDEEISHAKWLEARGALDTDKIERLTKRLRFVLANWNNDDQKFVMTWTSLSSKKREFMFVAKLAHHGLLGSVEKLSLLDVDLSPFPARHLASLTSSLTNYLAISNVRGCDLVSLLNSLKCENLYIFNQSLGREETQALVQAMESSVEEVGLGKGVTLDLETLVEYSGQGVCRQVELRGDTLTRYRKDMKKWANWKVDVDVAWTNIIFVFNK